jgi:small subunit ribosomal protein S6
VTGIIDRVKGWVSEAGGTVDKIDLWGKRRLSYAIRKQRESNYVLFNLSLLPDSTSSLEQNLRYTETIMRHMLTLVA